MAKQDLVVKLLLDSGAFGTDLREAERKAKQFSENMKSAGKTAGDFGKEIGLSAGALGKLGGVMTGAAGVIATVGAFKSIMESTHGTAVQFHSTIAGFKGVLDEFQESIATFDFTNFNNGLLNVFKNAKNAKRAMMDAAQSDVAYKYLSSDYKQQLKGYEAEYKASGTTKERQAEIVALVNEMLDEWEKSALGNSEQFFGAFLEKMKSEQDLLGLENDKDGRALAVEWLKTAAYNMTADRKQMEDDIADWAAKSKEIDSLDSKAEWKKFGAHLLDPFSKFSGTRADLRDEEQGYRDQHTAEVAKYQELMFKVEAYKLSVEDLQTHIANLERANQVRAEVDEARLQVMGWTGGSGKSSGGGNSKEDYIILENSIADLEKDIDKLEKKRSGRIVGSDDWIAATKKIAELNDQLKTQKKLQEELDKTYRVIPPPDEVEGSVTALKKLIAEQEKLRDDQVVGSDLWHKHNTLIQQYTKDLNAAEEATARFNGELESEPEKGSFADIQKNIKILEDLTNNVEVGSIGWETAMRMLNHYEEQLKELKQTQEEFTNQFISDEEKKAQAIEKFNEKLENRRAALSATGVVLNGLGDIILAYEDELSEKTSAVLSGLNNLFGDAINGVMSFIQIQQACATATGVTKASAMPFPYNLAAIATVVGSLASVFANIKQMANAAGRFAEGGIVGGTSYSGDKLFAMVNSGEMILNKKQQGNLANMIGGGGQVEFHISGDSLVGVLNNKQRKQNLIR